MPKESWTSVEETYRSESVRVFRLDRERLIEALRARAEQSLSLHPEVAEVRLFGSLARGDARPGSDADLLVIVDRTSIPFLERSVHYGESFVDVGIGCDVLVYGYDELDRMQREGNVFIRDALEQGMSLAKRAA